MRSLAGLLALVLASACAGQSIVVGKVGAPSSKASAFEAPALPVLNGSPESFGESRIRPVVGTRGMVVSDDEEASRWGTEVLRRGGNAVDAAVATGFALAVTRPHFASLGGGGFMVFCPAGGKPCQTLDYREKAPAKASRDMYKGSTDFSQNGALASGIPGVTAGLLTALEKWGTQTRQLLLSQPIALATQGFSFSSREEFSAYERWSAMNPAARKIFGCSGKPCVPGTRIVQEDLAKVLKQISVRGKDGFYKGWVAAQIAHEIQKAGGLLTEEDLKNYAPTFRVPLVGHYRGMEVDTMAPPSSGGALILQLLGYMELADHQGDLEEGPGSARTVHTYAHAMGLAFADRAEYFGDPDFVKVPLADLLSPAYLARQWKSYRSAQASLPAGAGTLAPEPQHTTHYSVVDAQGNAVSMTVTVNDEYGSGFVPEGTGVVMNNEMDDFSIKPGVPNLFGLVGAEANSIQAGKRPLSSMSPTIVRDAKGEVRLVLGAAGGPTILTSVFQTLMNRLRFGMSLPDAVAYPRIHEQWAPTELKFERFGLSAEVQRELTEWGYSLTPVPSLAEMHALERFPNGRVWGIADPRGEGFAAAE